MAMTLPTENTPLYVINFCAGQNNYTLDDLAILQFIGIRNYGKSSHDYYASFVVFDDGIPSCDDVSSLFLHLKFMMTFHLVMTFHNMMIAHHDDMN